MINREVVGGSANVTTTLSTDTVEKDSVAEQKYEISTKSSIPSTLMDSRDEEAKISTKVSVEKETESPNVVADDNTADEDDFDYYDEIRPVTEPSVYDSRLSSASQDRD